MNNRKQLQALNNYCRGYRWIIVCSFFFMLAELALSFVSPLIMSVTIDSVLDTKPLDAPAYFVWFIDSAGGLEHIRDNLWIMALAIVVLSAAGGLMRFLRSVLTNYAGEHAVKDLRDRLYSHIQRLPFSYHANAQTGDLIQRATNDVETVRRFLSNIFVELVRIILLFFIGVAVMVSLNVKLALISLILVPVVIAASLLFFRKIQVLNTRCEEDEGQVFNVIQENITGIRVVRAFGRHGFEMQKFLAKNDKLRQSTVDVDYMFANLWTCLDFICGMQTVLVSVFGIWLAVHGELSLGTFTAFLSYVYLFFWPIRGLGRIITRFSRSLIATSRIEEIFSAKEEDELYTGDTPDLRGDIVFSDVSFCYDAVPVLDHLNMTIPAGKTVAILGGTGSGKSTLAHLLLRLYEPTGGEITVGGEPLNRICKKYLRDRVGIVLQEPFLYSKTILQNIAIKTPRPDVEKVYATAKQTAIHDNIMGFDKGYDTEVGERGVTLSGGQKQRVAIARTLMSDSDILIFDDSLSAVDTRTDAQIRESLRLRRAGVTTVIISHRVTTLMEADKIFVLKNGRIAEEGTHEELLRLGGIYKATYDIQNATVES